VKYFYFFFNFNNTSNFIELIKIEQVAPIKVSHRYN